MPVCGMVKDARHRTRAFLPDGQEIGIAANPANFAHRHDSGGDAPLRHRVPQEPALEEHRRIKVDAIEGVGKKRREKLLVSGPQRFRCERGGAVEVVPRPVAERIKSNLADKVGRRSSRRRRRIEGE